MSQISEVYNAILAGKRTRAEVQAATGFDHRYVHKSVQRLLDAGKIRGIGDGKYVPAPAGFLLAQCWRRKGAEPDIVG